jgi:hypothetical protein
MRTLLRLSVALAVAAGASCRAEPPPALTAPALNASSNPASETPCDPEHVNATAGVCPAGDQCSCDFIGTMMGSCSCRPVPAPGTCGATGEVCKPPKKCCQGPVMHSPWFCADPGEAGDSLGGCEGD